MRVGIIQSCYIPWRGYFDFIRSVDLFILFDDVQFPQGRSWRNRNCIKTEAGLKWLTVPVAAHSGTLAIDEVRIADSDRPWQDTHRNSMRHALRRAPFVNSAIQLWEDSVSASDYMLSDLNSRLINGICRYLSIETQIIPSRPLNAQGKATERLLSLLQKVGAKTYLSGPAAKDYLDENAFRRNNIRLEYKSYDYAPYPQLWGPFESAVTVLDLIANVGPDARNHITSKSPDVIAVP